MNNKERQLHFRVSDEEYELIRQKMEQCDITSLSAYMRKIAIDGMIVNLQIPELREISQMLGYNGKNLNQIAKKLNSSKAVYAEDFADIKAKQNEITKLVRKIYFKLAEF